MPQSVSSVPQFGLGKTFYDGGTIDTNNLGGVDWEGFEREFDDTNYTTPAQGPRTPFKKVCRLMRNASGVTLLAKRCLRTAAGANWGKRLAGYTTTANEENFVGVLDEYLPSAGLVNNDLGWVTVYGPTLVLTDLAAGANNNISVGNWIGVIAGSTTGATTSGRAGLLNNTGGATTPLFEAAANRIGKALSANTTDQTNTDVLCFLTQYK